MRKERRRQARYQPFPSGFWWEVTTGQATISRTELFETRRQQKGENLATRTATAVATTRRAYGLPFVISASSAGTVIEWYDFYLYATLAPFFAPIFFPSGNDTASLLSAFATYAAGFLVRPFGAVFFGALGDIIGRNYTFLVTITVMGLVTVLVGFLPTYAQIGIAAGVILVILRLAQGLALSGEYRRWAMYVGEHRTGHKAG